MPQYRWITVPDADAPEYVRLLGYSYFALQPVPRVAVYLPSRDRRRGRPNIGTVPMALLRKEVVSWEHESAEVVLPPPSALLARALHGPGRVGKALDASPTAPALP